MGSYFGNKFQVNCFKEDQWDMSFLSSTRTLMLNLEERLQTHKSLRRYEYNIRSKMFTVHCHRN